MPYFSNLYSIHICDPGCMGQEGERWKGDGRKGEGDGRWEKGEREIE